MLAKCNKIAQQTDEIKATLSYLVTVPVSIVKRTKRQLMVLITCHTED